MTDEQIIEMKDALLEFANDLANALRNPPGGNVVSAISDAKGAAEKLARSLGNLV
jgi:hypothetical protein